MIEHIYKNLKFKKVKDMKEFKNILKINYISYSIETDIDQVYLVYQNEILITMTGFNGIYELQNRYKVNLHDYMNILKWKCKNKLITCDDNYFKDKIHIIYYDFIYGSLEYTTAKKILLTHRWNIKEYKYLLKLVIKRDNEKFFISIDEEQEFLKNYLTNNNLDLNNIKRVNKFITKIKNIREYKIIQNAKNCDFIICDDNLANKMQLINNFEYKLKEKIMIKIDENIKDNYFDADVIITNPTQYAVALKYDNEESSAPIVVLSGINDKALQIKDIAREYNIPIIEDPALARALYEQVDANEEIAECLYKPVAEIFTYIYKLAGKTIKYKQKNYNIKIYQNDMMDILNTTYKIFDTLINEPIKVLNKFLVNKSRAIEVIEKYNYSILSGEILYSSINSIEIDYFISKIDDEIKQKDKDIKSSYIMVLIQVNKNNDFFDKFIDKTVNKIVYFIEKNDDINNNDIVVSLLSF